MIDYGGETRLKFSGLTARELAKYAAMKPEWLVDGLFTVDEPILFGARSKCCKTLTLSDLAVGLASGTNFMDQFSVPVRRRVLFISGEANHRRMGGHLQRACEARGMELPDLGEWLRTETVDFPQLPSESDRADVSKLVGKLGIEVVIVDPLYRGTAGVDSARLAEMGSAIKGFQAACHPATMIVSHHVVKASAREIGRLPTLEDMTGAGVAESFGQWWLVGRNEEYQWNHKHDLCVQFGGREGQCGGKRIEFDEQEWTFDVKNLSEYREEVRETWNSKKEESKQQASERRIQEGRSKILASIRGQESPVSASKIKELSGQSGATLTQSLESLITDGTFAKRQYKDARNRVQDVGFIHRDFVEAYDQRWNSESIPDHAGLSRIILNNPA